MDYWHASVFVLLAASAAYNTGGDADSQKRGMDSLDALLSAARAHGFVQSDILLTQLASGDYGESTIIRAKAAMHPVTGEELAAVLGRVGFFAE